MRRREIKAGLEGERDIKGSERERERGGETWGKGMKREREKTEIKRRENIQIEYDRGER